jgi:predicted transcriptional regulator
MQEITAMAQTILEMATDLTTAQIRGAHMSPEALQDTLHKTYMTLLELKKTEQKGVKPLAPVDWRKSITRNAITCLECGAAYKQLSIRHLRQHDLNGQSYRAKYRIPRSQPLAARSMTAIRRKIVQETRPWEKAPTYVKAQRGKKMGRKRVVRGKG